MSGYGRALNQDEPAHPTRAWIEYATGGTAVLELSRAAEHRWIARPPGGAVMTVGAGDHLRIDRLGPGDEVEFQNVLARNDVGGFEVNARS